MPRLLKILTAAALGAVLLYGCGEGGAAAGATVRIYVSAPLRGEEGAAGRRLCDEAREQAAQGQGKGKLELRVVCLDASGPGGEWALAQVGANARRASEDSTAIAYLGEPDPEARKQSRPIVGAAGIAEVGGASGREAVAEVTAAIAEGDESEPRRDVFDALG